MSYPSTISSKQKQVHRILLVEDNANDSALCLHKLKHSGIEVDAQLIHDFDEFKQAVSTGAFNLILSDFNLPGWTGLDGVRWLRTSGFTIPFILVTGTLEDDLAVDCVKEGVNDYVLKDKLDRLPFAFRRALQEYATWQERNRAEELLRTSEEQYRLLFEANPNPMWVFDLETLQFLAVNLAAIEHYGFSRQEFMDMTIEEIRPKKEIERLWLELGKKEQGRHFSRTWQHRKKNGSIIDVAITSSVITFYGRRAKLVLAQDVTEKESLERQLRQAQKMEAIGQLASGVAHDFNNLLQIIMGSTELALMRIAEDSPAAAKLLEVKTASHKAAGLTRQLLLFSRQDISEPQTLDLNSVVAASEKFLRRLIGENIDIRCVLSGIHPRVTIDPSHMEQILMNIIINARDAMPKGGTLTIETGIEDVTSGSLEPQLSSIAGHYALLAISDTGQGMDADTKDRIFDPFFTTKEKGKGTGLGLATVHGIIKHAGGHITVYSEPGQGATFKIFLPLASTRLPELLPEDNIPILGQGETILLVEDDPSLRATVQEFLAESGYQVLTANDGLEAKAIVDQGKRIELLLTDAVMPRMSGPELIASLESKYPDMKTILMTGYTDDVDGRQIMARSARVIQKPFTRHALLEKMRAVLDATRIEVKTRTVLLMEDDSGYFELIADILRSSGFRVLPAGNGEAMFTESSFDTADVAIVDLDMADKTRFEIYKMLEPKCARNGVPLLFIASSMSTTDREGAVQAGADAFLTKPFSTDELVSTINNLVAKG
ncbi:MAG TPA: response regulator [Candidatus Solibacter sp.]|jgi:two-component system cell cycle sensor histidine kinase/response regulator CckA|nr:response regulator [Candidatus Solibacter sp.]